LWCLPWPSKSADPSKIDCVLECNKKGAPLVFAANDGEIYQLDKQEKSLEFVGRRVKVFGSVGNDRILHVGNFYEIEKAEDDESEAEAEVAPEKDAPAGS